MYERYHSHGYVLLFASIQDAGVLSFLSRSQGKGSLIRALRLFLSANLADHLFLLWWGCPLWFVQPPAGVCKETGARVLEPSEFWFIIQSPSITSQDRIYSRGLSWPTTCSLPVMVSCPHFLAARRNWAVFFAYIVFYYSFSSLNGKKRYSLQWWRTTCKIWAKIFEKIFVWPVRKMISLYRSSFPHMLTHTHKLTVDSSLEEDGCNKQDFKGRLKYNHWIKSPSNQ